MHSGSLLVTACVTSEGLKPLLCSYEHGTRKHTHTLCIFEHYPFSIFAAVQYWPLASHQSQVLDFSLHYSSLAFVLCCAMEQARTSPPNPETLKTELGFCRKSPSQAFRKWISDPVAWIPESNQACKTCSTMLTWDCLPGAENIFPDLLQHLQDRSKLIFSAPYKRSSRLALANLHGATASTSAQSSERGTTWSSTMSEGHVPGRS